MDIDFPIFGSDLPEGDAIRPPSEHRPSSDHEGEEEDQATVTAPIKRRTRTRKPIPADQRMELHNKDLSDWNANYLDNMEEAARLKNSHRAYNEAKKTAELIVWGMGIGGIGMRPPGITAPIPIDMFCGDGLFELYTGVDRNKIIAGKKHDRDSGIDEATEAEARRVRPRTDNEFDDGEQIGRAEGADEGIRLGDAEEVELPRDAPAALDDRQLFSAMPWNLSASVRWSSAVPRSARLGSAAGTLSTAAKGSSLRQRARLASASPLQGRGTFGDSDILRGLEGGDSDIEMQHSGLPEMMSSDGGFLADDIGDEENAAGAPRVTESLSAEGGNFLAFIADAVEEKQRRAEAARDPFDDEAIGDDGSDEVLFEDLLPPQQNSKMVACQGLMMVLALGTRGLVDVRQDQPFHEIGLRLTDKGKFSHLRVVEDLAENDGGGDGGEQEGEVSEEDMEIQGDIQEQMARGMDDDADEEIEEEDDKSDSSEDDDGSDYEG